MKKLFFTSLFIIIVISAFSQINAITDTGEEVLLFDNGTWRYVHDITTESKEIEVNNKEFVKSQNATFLVKSSRLKSGIWIDPKLWQFEKSADNEDAEFTFQRKGEDLYAMLISEKIEVPIENLKDIALQNASDAAPDIQLVREEYRYVNGQKVLLLQMSGTLSGIKFIYFGYYFSDENGTIQFITYTSLNLFKTYSDEMEDLLNGLVKIN